MCGLVGFVGKSGFTGDSEALLHCMADALIRRGPDDAGTWLDADTGVFLGHRRLSIVDLSHSGHQPMISASGRFVIVFNGEIYNHLDLRRELEEFQNQLQAVNEVSVTTNSCAIGGPSEFSWRGHSDTETLLLGFETWGIEATLKKTVGMFALGLWDRKEKVLTLARDRMGEKPLYYGFQNDTFLFGSELKALKLHPAFLGEIDRDVLCLYLRHCYIPAPYSIYRGIQKLLPGTYLEVQLAGCESTSAQVLTPKTYWNIVDIARNSVASPLKGSDAELIAALDGQLKESISLQMAADVPLGAFLSGGIDSSTVVALMQAQSTRPVKTFSIGFDAAGYNEAEYAQAVARHLGTEHTELYVSAADAIEVIPLLGRTYDEPFADPSQIPTFLVSKLANKNVKVALSGDGGDELFAGYNRAYIIDKWKSIEKIPFSIRKATGYTLKALTERTLDTYIRRGSNVNPKMINLRERLSGLSSRLFTLNSLGELIHSLASVIDNPEYVVLGGTEPVTMLNTADADLSFASQEMQMMLSAARTYLPDDILVKVDRAAMANSLETRVPLLDHRLVEWAMRLPLSMKIREGKTKWILRQVLYQYLPQRLTEHPKAGFSIPLAEWLRGSLKEWASELLDKHRLQQEGFFNVEFVRTQWLDHLAGTRNNQYILWNILMFQVWLEDQ